MAHIYNQNCEERRSQAEAFTLFPRSQRSIEIYCQEDDRVMCYWSEDEGSRLLFDAYYEPDGVDRKIEV